MPKVNKTKFKVTKVQSELKLTTPKQFQHITNLRHLKVKFFNFSHFSHSDTLP